MQNIITQKKCALQVYAKEPQKKPSCVCVCMHTQGKAGVLIASNYAAHTGCEHSPKASTVEEFRHLQAAARTSRVDMSTLEKT